MGWQKFPSDFKDRSEYFREYHLRNKERINARSKAWREANPERAREQSRRWHAEHPDKTKEKASRHRQTDRYKQTRSANRKRRYAAGLDRQDPHHYKKWYWQNPERSRFLSSVKEQRRRARKAGAAGSVTPAQLEARIAFYGYRCWLCRKPYEAVDHVIPLARGGTHWPSNLRPICAACNSSKGTRVPDEIDRRVGDLK